MGMIPRERTHHLVPPQHVFSSGFLLALGLLSPSLRWPVVEMSAKCFMASRGSDRGGRLQIPHLTAASCMPPPRSAFAAVSTRASRASNLTPVVLKISEAMRFDVTAAWILGRWPPGWSAGLPDADPRQRLSGAVRHRLARNDDRPSSFTSFPEQAATLFTR